VTSVRERLSEHPAAASALAGVLLLALASLRQPAMLSGRVLIDVVEDNAALGLLALAATWAILSGGIDLSVGAVLSLASIALAALIEHAGCAPVPAVALVLLGGLAFGAAMGACVHALELPPFLVTLAGLFLARGRARRVHVEALANRDAPGTRWTALGLDLGAWGRVTLAAPLFLGAVLACVWALGQTRFGRNVRAVGGGLELARLAGVPVGATRVGTYAVSGLLASAAGVVHALYTGAGSSIAGAGLELDAIAAAVVGGASLAGGVGGAVGTLFGVLFFGALQTFLIFEGTLSAGWARAASGALLLAFLALARWTRSAPRRRLAA
jgi:galactofuranose transport system permease protein